MIRKKGATAGTLRQSNDYYVRIREYIKSKNGQEFNCPEIVKATNIKADVVACVLKRWTDRGYLERLPGVRPFHYIAIKPIQVGVAKGEVADLVWKAMLRSGQFLTRGSILAMIQRESGNTYTISNVNNCLIRWYKDGHLLKKGSEYRIENKTPSRPICRTVRQDRNAKQAKL